MISCGDGGVLVNNLTWTSWNGSSARGTGTFAQDNCLPDCADGTFIKSRASVVLSNPVKTSTGMRFTQMSVNPSGQSPQVVPLSTN